MLTHQVGRFVDPTGHPKRITPLKGFSVESQLLHITEKSVTRSKVVGGKFKCFCNIVLSCSVQIVCLLFWQEEERGGHLLCWFVMSLQKNYFVVSVYPRTVCKCQVKKGYDLVNAKFSQFDITLWKKLGLRLNQIGLTLAKKLISRGTWWCNKDHGFVY